MQGIHFKIKDAHGIVVATALYEFDGNSRDMYITEVSPDDMFETVGCESLGLKIGRYICIMDPYYKQRMDGSLGIRVDDKKRVILL